MAAEAAIKTGRGRATFAPGAVVLFFAALSTLLTWPLLTSLGTHVPGATADDNVVFLWNFWWMRHALATPDTFWHTAFLFHPVGVDLALHTHTALNAFVGATLLGHLSIPTALNLTTLINGALNGLAAYLLASSLTSNRLASLAAGVTFAVCPMLMGHAQGHFNRYTAWGLPLYAWALLAAVRRRSWLAAAGAGLTLACVAYSDYYYVIYLLVFTLCLIVWRWLDVMVRRSERWSPHTWLDWFLLSVIAIAVVVILVIALTGGGVVAAGSMRISFTTGLNVRTLAWVLFFVWLWRRVRPVARIRLRTDAPVRGDAAMIAVCAAAFAVAIAPLLSSVLQTWQSGGYVTQTYRWRSAPAGVDLAGVIIGNPFGAVTGPVARRIYATLELEPGSEVAWLGVVPVIVLIATRRAWRNHPDGRFWGLIFCVFFVWALGPFVSVFGERTGLLSPQILLRYLPIVSNARNPGQAMIMVSLSIAMLLAVAIGSSRLSQSRAWSTALIAVLLIDVWPMRLPLIGLDRPAVYDALAQAPPGAVLEIPLGIRDGFGVEGRIDSTVLYYQSIHEKPIVGGYISRLAPAVVNAVHESPVLNTVLRLSGNEPVSEPPDPLTAVAALRSLGIRYVVINHDLASVPVRRYIGSLPMRLLMADGSREVFELR